MNDHDPENFRPLIETRNVASNDRNAKRFATKIKPSPAGHLSSARARIPLPKTST
jgi:hypothetical protein